MAKESYYTPVGVVKFPKTTINDKDYGYIFNPKGLDEDDIKVWKFVVVFDPKAPGVEEMLELLRKQHEEIAGANFQPFSNDKSKNEDGSVTENGLIKVNFTTYYPMTIVDCMKKPTDASVGWGSKVKIKFTTTVVNNKGKIGLGRYAKAMQILELQDSNQNLDGFGEETDLATPEQIQGAENETPWSE